MTAELQRSHTLRTRSALLSLAAVSALTLLKLGVGFACASLALVAAGLESTTDILAASLALLAIRIAGRPADHDHPYGHGRAEQLSALAESLILLAGASAIIWQASRSLAGGGSVPHVVWYAYVVAAAAVTIDLVRSGLLVRSGRHEGSPALKAAAVHAGADLGGSLAVCTGLLLVGLGLHGADAVAALAVALVVLAAAARLLSRALQQLMDRTPAADLERAERAVRALEPQVQLGRLRLREAAGRHFADVVILVAPSAAIAQGHDAADAVETALQHEFPGADVVVHVEPGRSEESLHERALAAAMSAPRVREVHNVTVLEIDGAVELSLHLKLPAATSLAEAHQVADDAEQAILAQVPEIDRVQTHIEPLEETIRGTSATAAQTSGEEATVVGVVGRVLGRKPRELRFLTTADGLVVLLTLPLAGSDTLASSHTQAKQIEDEIMRAHPSIFEVIVHTEP